MRDVSQSGRASVVGAIALACLCLCLCALASGASRVNGLTINVTYTPTSLQVKLSNGTVLTPGAVVPPGPYSLVVYDSGEYATPQFSMTGPSVSVSSDLNPTGSGIEVPMTFGPFVLQPSSSYEISDPTLSGVSTISLTTSATGTSASDDPKSSSGSTAAKSLGASSIALLVDAKGKPALTLGGKPVKTLKAGKYSVIVADQSAKAGLILGHGRAKPMTLSGAAATGATPRKLTFTAGRWFFETFAGGPKTYFKVT